MINDKKEENDTSACKYERNYFKYKMGRTIYMNENLNEIISTMLKICMKIGEDLQIFQFVLIKTHIELIPQTLIY